ncbi:hypothetical protein A2851_05250 [Candidatus Kaiserbacteria bacterium RIFCSPHIGHO2_01_FULL_53_29]|nr:MAG: hypothetical protein A2851_05250 [Candidatus Kaiserbacteria bacterium RIFCSPHIGHO2_01_FULL_53_29]
MKENSLPAVSNGVKKTLLSALVVSGCFLPLFANAQAYQYQRQGIFDCNQNGAFAMNVGSLTANGIYVPVADATVELNTGILVYKECVLREVIVRQREAASAAYLKRSYKGIQEGRNGNPQYAVNEGQELLTVGDQVFVSWFQSGALDSLNPAFKAAVSRAVLVNYDTSTRAPQTELTCPYEGDLTPFQTNPTQNFSFDAFLAGADPDCVPLYAKFEAQDLVNSRIAAAKQYQLDQWNWGRGYYALTDGAQDPLNQRVLTPASNVNSTFQNVIDSSVRQLESANDIGQMIGALYAGVATQIVADSQGLAGLSQSIGGQPSYLDQVSSQSGQGLRDAAVNVANNNLAGALRTEQQYNQVVKSIGSLLTQATLQLRGLENQCWALVISNVCTAPPDADRKCTAKPPASGSLTVATSTYQFAQAVIDSQIGTLAAQILPAIQKSDETLAKLTSIAARLSNPATQSQALQELDQLVSARPPVLHTPPDVAAITQQQQSTLSSLTNLLQTTRDTWTGVGSDGSTPANLSWDGTTNPGVGWCNATNDATRAAWVTKWK